MFKSKHQKTSAAIAMVSPAGTLDETIGGQHSKSDDRPYHIGRKSKPDEQRKKKFIVGTGKLKSSILPGKWKQRYSRKHQISYYVHPDIGSQWKRPTAGAFPSKADSNNDRSLEEMSGGHHKSDDRRKSRAKVRQ